MPSLREALEVCILRDLSFVVHTGKDGPVLRICPDAALPRIGWQNLEGTDDAFLICPFEVPEEGLLAFTSWMRWDPSMGMAPIVEAAKIVRKAERDDVIWQKEEYLGAACRIIGEMRSGSHEKVVLGRTKAIPLSKRHAAELFWGEASRVKNEFICLLNCAEHGCWLGASPEILVTAIGPDILIDSLAGTLPMELAPAEASHWGEKERKEQAFVTDHVVHVLSELGLGYEMEGPVVRSSPPVAHLHTRIISNASEAVIPDLVRKLHPTPAVCGTPREKALEVIRSTEPAPRGLYAGFWGPWRASGRTTLHVNIRCMQVFDDQALIHIGGGLTADSDPEKEWAETEMKALRWQLPAAEIMRG